MQFHIITLFPEMFDSYLGESIIARAIKEKKIKVSFYNPRDFTKDKHHRVDDKSYGGGPGMVMQAEPILRAVTKAVGKKQKVKVVIMSPDGEQFDNTHADRMRARYDHIVIICGRYEGIDARVKKALRATEISVGPYVLTGGELPAMIVVDAMTRRIPGVLGKDESIEERRVSTGEVYTRPDSLTYKGKAYRVPKVLLSGDHKKIDEWRTERSRKAKD